MVEKRKDDVSWEASPGNHKRPLGWSNDSSIHFGTIENVVLPDNVCYVKLDTVNTMAPLQCIWVAGAISGLMGINTSYIPSRGARVVLVTTGVEPGLIVGTFSDPMFSNLMTDPRHTTAQPSSLDYHKSKHFQVLKQRVSQSKTTDSNKTFRNTIYDGQHMPRDMTESEMDITNHLNVGAQFLRHFSKLMAGDMAKVECSLIDDMVRIVSQTFRHYSAFGDFTIHNDGGRLNCVWNGTNNDWETYGLNSPEAPRQTMEEPHVVDIPAAEQQADPRWRFQQFVGFLGDFVNMFVSEPPESAGGFNTGKGRVHINENGGVLIQSIDSVGLERCSRIAVPHKLLEDWDPDGDRANEELPFPPDLSPLKVWMFEDDANAFLAVYQIRHYVKWFSNKFTKAQFLRLNKDWKVPAESEIPAPDRLGSLQKDKGEANEGATPCPDQVYATVRIMQDGSILLLDSYDNTITMSKNGVQISSFRNMYLEAAGSINMVAGGDINMSARRNVDITAMKYGITMKAQTFFQQYCKEGGILLKSDSVAYPDILEDDNPVGDQTDTTRVGGICLSSKKSCIRLISEKASIGLQSGLETIISGPSIGLNASSLIQFGDFARFTPSVSTIKGVVFTQQSLIKSLIVGNGYKSIFDHPGHIPTLEDMEDVDDLDDEITERFEDFRNKRYNSDFKYRNKEEYVTDGNEKTSIKSQLETVTQQALRLDAQNLLLGEQTYGDWNYEADAYVSTDKNNISHAWPGITARHWVFTPEQANIWEPDTRDPMTLTNQPPSLELESYKLKYAKEMT